MQTRCTSYTTASVLNALDVITKGRIVKSFNDISAGTNPYVVIKTSNIPGKSVMEIPGLVFGSADTPVTKVGVAMTMTESVIELASAIEIELLVVHHPVADAANSGGVPFAHYLPLYNISVIELHEAFHGLHPGVAFMHGHRKLSTDTCFGGIPGNVLHVGEALDGIRTAGDIVDRLNVLIGRAEEDSLLRAEREIRLNGELLETTLANPCMLLSGSADSPVKHVLHFFPHTGFNIDHLDLALSMYPQTDTLIASISRVRGDHPLAEAARKRGLTLIVGNPHSVEILENGMPLSYALQYLLPELEVYVLRERITAENLRLMKPGAIADYGKSMALQHLVPAEKTTV